MVQVASCDVLDAQPPVICNVANSATAALIATSVSVHPDDPGKQCLLRPSFNFNFNFRLQGSLFVLHLHFPHCGTRTVTVDSESDTIASHARRKLDSFGPHQQ